MTNGDKPKPLTPTQCRLLNRLTRGPQTSRELAAGARSKSATTTVLRALEARGLVASEKLEKRRYDERRYSLTAKANVIGYREGTGSSHALQSPAAGEHIIILRERNGVL